MGNTREEKLKYAFGAYPQAKELFVTSDDQMFFSNADAAPHARTLKDTEVTKEIRSDYVEKTKAEDDEDEDDEEMDALREQHKQLFNAYPNKNAKLETIKDKIDKELARLAEVAAKDAQNAGVGGTTDPDKEN